MDYNIARKDGEINHLLNKCDEAEQQGKTAYPGMSYEQGLKDAILWLTGEVQQNPLED